MVSLVSKLQVDQDRLMESIADLANIGALPNGGVQRLAFSPEDCLARDLIQQWMRESGMQVRIDPAGNIIGRYPGRFEQAPALTTGSHIDTVPNAGHYDGTYGVLAGLEVIRTLRDRRHSLDHPLDLIVFADEERTMVGCKALSGNLGSDALPYRSTDGEPIQSCLARVGGDWSKRADVRLTSAELAAFVELHIEQGPVLESAQKEIGIVTGIVAQQRYIFTVEGRGSHAGTTPMHLRQDALVAASRLVLAVHALGNRPGDQVATVGQLDVAPNVANTIPDRVELSLDIRDLDEDHLDQLMTKLEAEMAQIAAETETRIQLSPLLRNQSALANSRIQTAIAQVCEDLSLSYMQLPSRASHDAQEMAQITDMGMIFVPSEAGISHAETEYTSPEHCAQGANVLLHTLIRLDQHYRCSTAG
ncbi:Zn-dependent hydrolase [Leptolyngbya sp. BC1307]|uniref:Zn-dependent hydrolase n=1 Tax=Leptolyngbya sp. BC1307 TaxID=2029589 RepID=UPI000EFCFB78|nr:Zn-dependent hydrolase [Leptolyngbya sp. BC1307]